MSERVVQSTFSGGELSPRLHGRVDSDLYRAGVARAENFQVTPQGSAVTRPPTELASGAENVRRVLALPSGHLVLLEPGVLHVFSARSRQVLAMPAQQLVENGSFEAGSAGWGAATESRQFEAGALKLFAGQAAQDIYGLLPGAGNLLEVRVRHQSRKNVRVWVRAYAADGGELPPIFDESRTVAAVDNTPATIGGAIVVPLAAAMTRLWIEVSGDSYEAASSRVEIDSVSLTTPSGIFSIGTPWTTEEQLQQVVAVPLPGDQTLLVGGAPPLVTGVAATMARLLTMGVATATYPAGEWRLSVPSLVGAGFLAPEAGAWANGRLWLARGPRLIGSRSGMPTDFSLNAGDPSYGIDAKLATPGSITWLRGQHDTLLIGTTTGEYRAASPDGVLSVGTLSVRPESEYGSAPVPPVGVGSQVAYVSGDRRRVRLLAYSREADNWGSQELGLHAEHLARAGILEAHSLRDPYGVVVLVLADGTMACCTASKADGLAAWWRWTTAGRILSAAPVGAQLWLLVDRGRDGTFLEVADFGRDTRWALDCAVVEPSMHQAETGEWVVEELWLLEGRRVCAVDAADERVVIFGEFEVSDGVVALPQEPTPGRLVVGLPYPTARLMTLPPAETTGLRRRWVRIGLQLHDSAMPKIDGVRPPERHPSTPMDEGEPGYTGDVEVQALGWERGGRVTIEQDLPLRTEVLSIFGTVQANRT